MIFESADCAKSKLFFDGTQEDYCPLHGITVQEFKAVDFAAYGTVAK